MAVHTPESPPNRYGVTTRRDVGAWRVAIVDRQGREVASRSCGDEREADTFASTVRQHARWLSEEKFREYYRLEREG